ncbi:nuclear transport factor 2 family protein [Massilia putida]|uniref:nuclear transport factor 2 family protein n=1 Tax=Massilia putida TaxID=1141883 RepID=UPI000950CC1F|nr:nuclear transport factor 2 family protein [Massilia putida]
MDAQDNKRIVMEGYRLFQNGDIPAMMAYAHDDAVWIGPDAEALPFAGSFHGKAEVARFFSELGAAMQPTRFVIKDVIAENDKVVVLGEATWLVKSTGRSYDSPWVHVFTMRDGKFVRVEALFDTAPAERAFRPDRPDQMAAAMALRH